MHDANGRTSRISLASVGSSTLKVSGAKHSDAQTVATIHLKVIEKIYNFSDNLLKQWMGNHYFPILGMYSKCIQFPWIRLVAQEDPSFVLASKYFLNKTLIGNTYFTICRQHNAEKRFLWIRLVNLTKVEGWNTIVSVILRVGFKCFPMCFTKFFQYSRSTKYRHLTYNKCFGYKVENKNCIFELQILQ